MLIRKRGKEQTTTNTVLAFFASIASLLWQPRVYVTCQSDDIRVIHSRFQKKEQIYSEVQQDAAHDVVS